MSIEERYFAADKNYLLKTVQAFSKHALLEKWVQEAYNGYMCQENPLGLEDDFTLSIKSEMLKSIYLIEDIYDIIAAVYRYKHGDNQLSFMWDGRTHMEHYDEEWRTTFKNWIIVMCQHKEVYRSLIKAAMTDPRINTDFLSMTIRRFVLKHFNVRITRSQRLMVLSA